jgi:4-methyl-5(b-hydroxyethyl)-thiazole monophosphate biosynthesis
MQHVITVLATGFEETEAVTVIDLLRRARVGVTILGLDSLQVAGAHGIVVAADKLLAEWSGPFDGIVLPGGMPGTRNLAASSRLLDLIRETYKRGALCAAICAAPMVLGRAGVLDGRKATCYPGFEKELGAATFVESPVVRDGNVVTSRGVGTAIPFAIELIAGLTRSGEAQRIQAAILF